MDRADHRQENMGLTSWEDAPQGKVHKYRIVQDRLFESDFDRVIKQIESGSQPDIAEE